MVMIPNRLDSEHIPIENRAGDEEIPVEASIGRPYGKSRLKTIFILRLHGRQVRRFIKFGLVGLSGFFVNAAMLEVFARTSVGNALAQVFKPWATSSHILILASPGGWAAALAVECSILNNFVWNNLWTFRQQRPALLYRTVGLFLKFNFFSMGSIGVQFLCVGLATYLLGNSMLVRQFSLILTIGLFIVPLNWLIYNKIIWKSKSNDKS